MNDLLNTPLELNDVSLDQILALNPEQLQVLDGLLTRIAGWTKTARTRLEQALSQRYDVEGRDILTETGREFGIAHVTDGQLRVTVEFKKTVNWDQPKLAEIAERIQAAGENVSDYLDVEYSITESRFNNWPAALKEQFAPARSVKPAKTSYRLALLDTTTL